MDDLFAARTIMAVSLGFHILFAIAGMAMPSLMVAATLMHQRTGAREWRDLSRRWAKGTAILFAVGAVSGTVLSFELGLLWPRFMELFGPLVGLPFTLEGFAFFFEGIFLGILLYGGDRLTPKTELFAGAAIALSGVVGGALVLAVNGFMNTPRGFRIDDDGKIVDIDPLAAMFNPAFASEALHMILAAYAATSVLVLGVHAVLYRRAPSLLHRAALRLTLVFALVAVPLLLASGDLAAKHIAKHQPLKLAAAEALFHTTTAAPLTIGGIPEMDTGEVHFAIEIPYALSILAFADPGAEVKGLDAFPRELWPPVVVTHIAFQVMVGAGLAMLALVLLGAFVWKRLGGPEQSPLFLRLATYASPLGLIAIEAGWTVTEVGRQPWIVNGVLLVKDAVTPLGGLVIHLIGFVSLYLFLGIVVVVLLRRHLLLSTNEGAHPPESDAHQRRAS
jgi:cytochrome d ubiquinol oxidase subunit I